MNIEDFSALVLVVLGTFGFAASCGGTSASGQPSGDGGGGAPQNGGGGIGSGSAAAASGNVVATGAGGTGGMGSSGAASGSSQATGSAGTSATAMIGGSGGTKGDGGGGMVSGGDAGSCSADSTDAGGGACQQVATAVDRSCTASTDCLAVSHQTDYMGQIRLLGIRSSEMAHFTQLEKSCHATMQSFSLPGTTADDGSLVDAMARAVTCQAGICMTFSPACGQPCACGHVCITCGSGASAKSVCSQLCAMGSCTEPPRTSCLGGASLNGGEGEFCFDPVFAGGFMSSSCHR